MSLMPLMVLSLSLCVFPQRMVSGQGSSGYSAANEEALGHLISKKMKFFNYDKIESHLKDIDGKSLEELDDLKRMCRSMRETQSKNWKTLQDARNLKKGIDSLGDLWAAKRLQKLHQERDAELARIDEIENEEFERRHGFPKKSWISPTPEQRKIIAAWSDDKYRNQKQDVLKYYHGPKMTGVEGGEFGKVIDDARNLTDPTDRELDKLQAELLDQLQTTIDAERRVAAAIARRNGGVPPEDSGEAEGVAGSSGSLSVSCAQSEFDVQVGESAIVPITVHGGKAPYSMTAARLDGEVIQSATLSGETVTSIPFSFEVPGNHTVYVKVQDETNPRQEVQLTLTFRVTGPPAEEEQEEAEEEPTDQSKTQDDQQDKQDDDDEEEAEYKPWRLPPGNYRFIMKPGIMVHACAYLKEPESNREVPLEGTIAIDQSGRVTGSGGWELTPDLVKKDSLEDWSSIHETTTFHIEGDVDWETGKADLRLVDGRRKERMVDNDPDSPVNMGADAEFEFTLEGWQMGDPRFLPLLAPTDVTSQHKSLFLQQSSDGSWNWTGRGWIGCPTLGNQDGGSSRLRLKKWIKWTESETGREEQDVTQYLGKSWAKPQMWLLKILGPVDGEEPAEEVVKKEEEPEQEKPEGELVAFGIWPESPLHVQAGPDGAMIQLNAVGLYEENIFDVKRLHDDRSEWATSSGLKSTGTPGKFRAPPSNKPRKHRVRVRRQRNDGTWMSDTITIVVKPASPPTPKSPR